MEIQQEAMAMAEKLGTSDKTKGLGVRIHTRSLAQLLEETSAMEVGSSSNRCAPV